MWKATFKLVFMGALGFKWLMRLTEAHFNYPVPVHHIVFFVCFFSNNFGLSSKISKIESFYFCKILLMGKAMSFAKITPFIPGAHWVLVGS